MDDIAEGPSAPRPRRLRAAGLVGAGLVGGLVLAGLNVASAQTGDPTPAPSTSPRIEKREGARPFKGPGRHGGKHGMHGLGRGVLHGEFVTRGPDGGFQTMASQHGEATAVSATSITVTSEDGFSRTYAVTDDTLVNAGDEGTADIATGDTVHVLAVVTDGTARAVRVVDVTQVKRLGDRWRPAPKAPKAPKAPAPSESAAT